MTRRIKLKLSFNGTNYCGWLKQNNGISLQETLQNAVMRVTGEKNLTVNGCSRTDSGVHANSYIADFDTVSTVPAERFKYAINSYLPNDIYIIESSLTDMSFHSAFSAKSKTYRYIYTFAYRLPPVLENRVLCVRGSADHSTERLLKIMNEAAETFIGEHDFSAFRNEGGYAKTSNRVIFDASVRDIYTESYPFTGDIDNMYCFEVTGSGFLYNMVRIMAGTILCAANGRFSKEDIKNILESRDRRRAGFTAPACGLYLYNVSY